MKEIDAILIYEHAARELDVVSAVTALLRTQYSVEAEVIHWPTGFYKIMDKVRPKLVVLPFCYYEETFRPLLAYWRKSIFFNLTWEQLFYSGNEKAKTPRGDFAVKHVVHHAWSELYASFLTKSGIPEAHIFVNGQPAYTLYDEPYRNYFDSRQALAARHSLDPAKKWIFFPENYNWAFYSEGALNRFVQTGLTPDDINLMREFCNLSLTEALHWCNSVARSGNVELIVRPRPAISVEEFRTFAQRVLQSIPERLHILQSESVREWILASDIVMSSRSTSLIEAAVACKEFYIIEPRPIPEPLQMDWYDLAPHLKSEQEVLDVSLGKVRFSLDNRLAEWARRSMMAHGDSIQNLAEYLFQLLHGEILSPPPATQKSATPTLKFIPHPTIWKIYNEIRRRLKHGISNTIAPEYVKDVYSRDEIESRIQKWAQLLCR
jgi:hypothetical protein